DGVAQYLRQAVKHKEHLHQHGRTAKDFHINDGRPSQPAAAGQAHEAKRQGQHKANTDADDRNKQGERYARRPDEECCPVDVPVEVDGHVRITVWSGAILATDVLDDFFRRLVAKPFGVDLVVAAIVDDGLDGIVGLFNPFTALGKDKATIDGVV